MHHHFRPSGVRRVIELAAPHLVREWPGEIRELVLAAGEPPDASWLKLMQGQCPGTQVRAVVWPAIGYASELRLSSPSARRRAEQAARELAEMIQPGPCLVWAHNLGLGRNLDWTRALMIRCRDAGIPMIAHHHDWWFENRWHHFTAMRGRGFRGPAAVADAVLADAPGICHVAINRADASVLRRHFPGRAGWLPNPAGPTARPPAARVAAARRWLADQIGESAPVWLAPCRLLRRKNILESLLLARWLRPEAWLVTTGGASSEEERPYADALAAAALERGWRLRLGVLRDDPDGKPSVPELFGASEAVLLTSLQEGFGLPYIEAAAAGRPLLARQLPDIAPDMAAFGFKFPQVYREIRIDPSLFDWRQERRRQARLFAEWKGQMPRAAARLAGTPALLAAGQPQPAPFSRLTLTAQLEVLDQPADRSWARCVRLNPFLAAWRRQAAAGRLAASAWPASAASWLGGRAYARAFIELAQSLPSRRGGRPRASRRAQESFLRWKLRPEYLYPLLWNIRS